MTKQDSQMWLGAEALEIIMAHMPQVDTVADPRLATEILERYMGLVRYVSSHSTRQSGYTLAELSETLHGDCGFEFDLEIVAAVDSYCDAVDALYQEGA